MLSKTKLSLVMVIALMIGSLTVTFAQTRRDQEQSRSRADQTQTTNIVEWKKRIFEQIAAGVRTQAVEKITADSLPAEPSEAQDSPAAEQANPSAESEAQSEGANNFRARQRKALLGTWDLVLTFSDGSQVKSTLTVAPGRNDSEGSVLHAAEASLLLPNPTTAEQGIWEHATGRIFFASYRGFAVDEKFEKPFGTIGFRHVIRVSADQESFVGRAVFEVVDAQGTVLFSDNIQTRGTRQHILAP